MLRQIAVVARIPIVVVDAIEDADHRGAARAQDRIQPHAVFRRLDLARVGWAHGRDQVGVRDASAEQIDLARGERGLIEHAVSPEGSRSVSKAAPITP